MLVLLSLLAILVLLLHLHLKAVYSRFSKYGVKNLEPWPIIGNILDSILRRKHTGDELKALYTAFPGERFVGRFEFTTPVVLIRDLELIKKITIKDFEHFTDHRNFVDGNCNPIFGRNLLMLKGQEWKYMRSKLSPAFTSSKIRLIIPYMMEAIDHMSNSIKRQIAASGVDFVDLDCRDLTSRFANDVIACSIFGLKVDSHADVNNKFYRIGSQIATFGTWQKLLFALNASFPKLMKKLKLKFFSRESTEFFSNLVRNIMTERENENIVRPDVLHLLMQANKGKMSPDDKTNEVNTEFATAEEFDLGKDLNTKEWTDIDLIAQALIFFLAGFETVSSATAFLFHELALNPDVQERLAMEIKEHDANSGETFDFNSVQRMTYLDMVVSEVLRRWSPAVALDRICTKDYNLGKPNDRATQDYIIHKGESLLIPIWAFHHNPEYFPDPYKFDPERFSEENKLKINRCTYMPFGLGPRNCIGSRFGLCEVKLLTYQLVKHVEVMPCQKTRMPGHLDTDTFTIRIEGGHWLRFQLRK